MLTNFTHITHELTPDEMAILPLVIAGFKTHSKENPIKEPDIIHAFNSKSFILKAGRKQPHLSGARLRKLVNHIRTNGMLPLIATSQGYYVSHDKEDIENQINSLRQRARSINACADGMSKFM